MAYPGGRSGLGEAGLACVRWDPLAAAGHEERAQGQRQVVDVGEAEQDAQTSRSGEQHLAANDPGEHTAPRGGLAFMSFIISCQI
jgi:hypothetical protein